MKKIWLLSILFLSFAYAQEMDNSKLEERLKEVYVRLFELKKEAETNGFSPELSNRLTELSNYAEELENLLEENGDDDDSNDDRESEEPMMEETLEKIPQREMPTQDEENKNKRVNNLQKRLEKSLQELEEAKDDLSSTSGEEKDYLDLYIASLSHEVRKIQQQLENVEKMRQKNQGQRNKNKNNQEQRNKNKNNKKKWQKHSEEEWEMSSDDSDEDSEQEMSNHQKRDKNKPQHNRHNPPHQQFREHRQNEHFGLSREELEVIEREKMLERESRELVYKIHTAKGMAKKELTSALVRILNEIFEIRENRREHEIDKLEQQLDRARSIFDKRQKNRDQIIEMRLEMLTGEAEEWKW